jgi:hypothetical protein
MIGIPGGPESFMFTVLGDVFAAKSMYDSALYYYRMSIPVSERVQMKLNKLTAYIGMATIFKEQHNFDSANGTHKNYCRKEVLQFTR